MAHLLSSLSLLALSMAPEPPAGRLARAAITLELSQAGAYLPGDSVSVRVHVETDGYLLVLRADASGRIRVLFPLDPTDDAYVRGGRRYDLLSRGDRAFTFLAEASGGNGTILAALSPDPLTPGQYALNGHWDYHVLSRADDEDELALRAVAEKMIPTRFEYDVLPYFVEGGDAGLMAAASDGGGGSTSLAIGVGGCWGCGFGGWWGAGWGWGIGWGWGSGWTPVWAWGPPVWGWGPGWGWGGTWGGGGWGNPGWGPGTPGAPERFPGLGPAESTPYRPRVASNGRGQDGMGVRGSLGSNGTGYRTRSTGGDLGVRGSLASTAGGYRGREATGSRATTGRSGGRVAYGGGRGVRVEVPGRSSGSMAGRGAAVGSRGYASSSGMGGRGGVTRGTMSAPRGGGYSGAGARGMSGGRGAFGGGRGFSGGSRGFSGGGGRGR